MEINTLYEKGFTAAISTKCSEDGLIQYLEQIKSELILFVTPDYHEKKLETKKIQSAINTADYEKKTLQKRLASLLSQLDFKEKKIERLEFATHEKDQDEEAHKSKNAYTPFAIGCIIFSFITLFLILFYSSIGFTIIYDSIHKAESIFNPYVFREAFEVGEGGLVFTMLFPFIFMGVGFTVYTFTTKKTKKSAENSSGSTLFLILLLFTFEAILSYKITADIYQLNYSQGMYEDAWHFLFIFSEPNFYLILFLGFGIYLLWGILLNYLLNHPYREYTLNPSERNERIIQLNDQLIQLNEAIGEIKTRIAATDLKTYNNQVLFTDLLKQSPPKIDYALLKKKVNDFMEGYNSYAKNALNQNLDLFNNLNQNKEAWLLQQKEA